MTLGKKKIDMTTGPLFSKIIKFTIPLMLANVLQLTFNAADLIVVGNYCGSNSVGAVGATSSLTVLIINLFMGLSVGTGVVTAHAAGAKDERKMSSAVHTAIPIAVIGGVLLFFVGFFCSPIFLQWMDTPEEIIGLSTLYMRIYFCGMIGNLVYAFGSSILRALGDTQRPLIFLTISGVLNVILNVIFVREFDMDVAGVALATALTQLLSATLVMITLMRRDDACRFELKKVRIDKTQLLAILRIGIPAGLQSAMYSIANVTVQSSVNSFGAAVVSGNSASHNIEMFVYNAQFSFHHAAVNFVGQNIGAKKYDRVDKSIKICLLSAVVLCLVLGPLLRIFAPALLGIYIKDSAESIAYGIVRIRFVGSLYAICTLMDTLNGALRGFGASFTPMITSLIGTCAVRIGWIYTVFASHRTLEWLYVVYPISWILTFAAQLVVLYFLRKKTYVERADAI